MAFDPEQAVPVAGLRQIDRGGVLPRKSATELGAERAAAESSAGERFLAGVGHSFVNFGRGLHQVELEAADMAGLNGAGQARHDLQKDIDNAREIDRPLLSTTAGKVGDMVGTAALTAPVPGAGTFAGAGLTGAALGSLEPVASGESRLANTVDGAANGVAGKALGDAGGTALKYVLGRIMGRSAGRQAEKVMESGSPPVSPRPMQRPPPPSLADAPVPIAPLPAGRIVSGGGNHSPELTDEERRLAAGAPGIHPHEVPPEAAEVAHLFHTDLESALRIHAEHPQGSAAFVAAVRERNRANAETGVVAIGSAGSTRTPATPKSNGPVPLESDAAESEKRTKVTGSASSAESNAHPREENAVKGNVSGGTSSTIRVGPYGAMVKTLKGAALQANHLNQDAVFRDIIATKDGISNAMSGNAFTDVGSPHYEFHSSLESFHNRYRRGGDLFGSTPTNAQYGVATEKALIQGGYSQTEAADMAAQAAAQRASYGLSPSAPIPRVPGRLNQKKRRR